MMFKRTQIYSAALATLGGTLLLAASTVSAQSSERIEVTGSRIKTIGAVSASPISSIAAEEINSSQPAAVEEVIRGLAAAIPAIGPGTNNGTNGTASIDLRGLGSQRTLTLMNGRRLVPATLGGSVDTNTIPLALLDRIDLVTGGASAVYGADAVAGVVNFVLKKNFQGVEAQTTYGISDRNDAKRYRNDLTLGSNLADGRGNVALNVSTTRTTPLTQGQRSYGVFQLDPTTGNGGGSTTAVPAYFAGMPPPLNGNKVIDATTGLLRAAVATDQYNFNPPNFYQTPLDRTQITAIGHFSINEYADVYAELLNTKGSVVANLAPSGSFTSTYSLPIGNAFLTTPVRNQLCAAYNISAANCVVGNTTEIKLSLRRRFVELGPRINDFINTSQQYTVGVRGTVPTLSNWSYDAYVQHGTTDQVATRVNWGSFSKVQQALRAVSTTACTVATNGCVPLNIFGPAGTITKAMLDFINLSSVQTTYVQQNIANASLSGDLGSFKSPWSKSPIALVVGAEERKLSAGNRSDAAAQIGGEVLGSGAPTPDRKGGVKLTEGFLETQVPVADGRPGVYSLNLEGGFRQTEFKTDVSGKNYGSWKYGLDWAPIKGLRFRAMQQRATRSPSVNELYAPVVTGLTGLAIDPCQLAKINVADSNTPGTLSALCKATGVPANQIGFVAAPSASQANNTDGGNPNLGPEEADTTTIGLVFEPDFLPGLSMTLDVYKIKIKKAVSSPGTSQVINGCYTAALNPGFSPNAPFCGLIGRDPLTGGLNGGLGVITQSSNLGAFDVQGVDFGVNYRLQMKNLGLDGWGRVDIALNGTQYTKWDFKSLPTLDTLSCLGQYGSDCGAPTNKVKWNQRTTWNMGALTVGYNWRHLSGVSLSAADQDGIFAPFLKIPAVDYIDLSAAFDVTKNFRVSLAVNNATDKKPPIVGTGLSGSSTNSGNTYPQAYDTIGRFYSMTARLKF